MEKVEFFVNFLKEFMVGSDMNDVDAKLFHVMIKSAKEAKSVVDSCLGASLARIAKTQQAKEFFSQVNNFERNLNAYENLILKRKSAKNGLDGIHQQDSLEGQIQKDGMIAQRKGSSFSIYDTFTNLK
jgi:hypothetical protein